MSVWKVNNAVALSPTHGQVYTTNDVGSLLVAEVWVHWWDRLRGITIQQKLELVVLKQRTWCAKRNKQERERQSTNLYLKAMVKRLNEQDKAKTLPSGIEIRKL